MASEKTIASPMEIAQFRFALIAPVIQGLFPDEYRTAYYKRVTEKPLVFPDGRERVLSYKTHLLLVFLFSSWYDIIILQGYIAAMRM